MWLHNPTTEEKEKLLKNMVLYGYLDPNQINTFYEMEFMTKEHIKYIGKYLSSIDKLKNINKKETYKMLNKRVYDYIMNVDDIQTKIRYKMNEKIISDKNEFMDDMLTFAKNNGLKNITQKKILSGVLKMYNKSYDEGGILDSDCLNIFYSTNYDLIYSNKDAMFDIFESFCQ